MFGGSAEVDVVKTDGIVRNDLKVWAGRQYFLVDLIAKERDNGIGILGAADKLSFCQGPALVVKVNL